MIAFCFTVAALCFAVLSGMAIADYRDSKGRDSRWVAEWEAIDEALRGEEFD